MNYDQNWFYKYPQEEVLQTANFLTCMNYDNYAKNEVYWKLKEELEASTINTYIISTYRYRTFSAKKGTRFATSGALLLYLIVGSDAKLIE